MIRRMGVGAAIAIMVVLGACAPGGETAAPAETRAAPATASLPSASVLIAQRVADYDAWKLVFDDHLQARKDASCLGHYLKRGIDDPDKVYVYCLATDADRLRAFLDGTDLAEVMKNAGVQGAPEITLMKPMSRNLVSGKMLPGIIIMHPVEDYDRWRVAYDAFDSSRRQSGIIGQAVSQGLDNPNHVIVYHQANDEAALRAFVDSAELADTMQLAGVAGAPDIRFIRVVDFGDY